MQKIIGYYVEGFVLCLVLLSPAFGLTIGQNADQYKENFSPETRPHFSALWLEPAALSNRYGYLSSSMVDQMFNRYQQYGIKKIVVAYSHLNNAFLYEPHENYYFTAYSVSAPGQFTKEIVRSWTVSQRSPTLDGTDNKYIVNAIMDSARNHGMTVYLGLSQTGDTYYLNDTENLVRGNVSGMMIKPDSIPYFDRYSQNINSSIAIAHDLYNQFKGYGDTFEGWYLPQETSCLDIGMDYYYRPVATSLKQSYPDKKVMVSPSANPRVCFANPGPLGYETYMRLVGESLNVNGKALKLIDVFNYQDGLGAGTYVTDGAVNNYYKDSYRLSRMFQVYEQFKQLKLVHAQAGTEFWINTEIWEMDGSCNKTADHYCDPYVGTFFSDNPNIFDRGYNQLVNYAGQFNCTLMLNEGFTSLNYGDMGLPMHKDQRVQDTSIEFTLKYESYLRDSQLYYLTEYMDWNPPQVTSLKSNPTIVKTPQKVTIQATAGDNKGVTKVWFFLNGKFVAEDNQAPFEYSWQVSGTGSPQWSAWAFDLTGAHGVKSAMTPIVSISPSFAPTMGTDPEGKDNNEGAPETVDGARGYPVPFRPAYGANGITFDRIPAETAVRIYTIDGRPVKILTTNTEGAVLWDLTNDDGSPVSSGVFLALMEKNGGRKRLKVVVQK
jgi:hypothetical protein